MSAGRRLVLFLREQIDDVRAAELVLASAFRRRSNKPHKDVRLHASLKPIVADDLDGMKKSVAVFEGRRFGNKKTRFNPVRHTTPSTPKNAERGISSIAGMLIKPNNLSRIADTTVSA